MGFTPFIDDLALIEVLLGFIAIILAYAGVMVWWNIRANDAVGLRKTLKSAAVPLGGVGLLTLVVALWGEFTWPFLTGDGLGGYNIFFFDPLTMLGIVLVAYSVCCYLSLRLQYVGLLALVFGAVTAFYGWTGYTASPAFTKDPYDTFLLYGAFALVGVMTFPTTIIVDYYLAAVEKAKSIWQVANQVPALQGREMGTRAAGPAPGATVPTPSVPTETSGTKYHLHVLLQIVLLAYPFFCVLAAIASLWYFDTTLPGHLGKGAAAAP